MSSTTGRPLRYGVVGTGYFGAALCRTLRGLAGAEVVAVYDPSHAEAVARELGAWSAPTMLTLATSDQVDVVVVASPNDAHVEAVLAAADAGKHIFCEKPIALSSADCAAMVSAAQRAGVIFMAGHVMHFMDGVRRVKALVANGGIGEVVFCRAVRTGWEPPATTVSWKKLRASSGGHLYHHIHELDLVLDLMGTPETAVMVGGNVAHVGDGFGDEDDLLLGSLEFSGGRCASLEYGSAFRWPEHHVLIQGTTGAVRIDLQDVGVEVRTEHGVERFPLHRDAAEDDARRQEYLDAPSGGGVTYGAPGTPLPPWLQGIVETEMTYLHALASGGPEAPDLRGLTDGTAAARSILVADALTTSLREARKVTVASISAESGATLEPTWS